MDVSAHSHQKEFSEAVIEIPILCRFWMEDGVWNGEAVHLPVVVFGHSLEESMHNLSDAILSHLDAERQVGNIDKTITFLRTCAREKCLTIEEMAPNRLLSRFNAALRDQRVTTLV